MSANEVLAKPEELAKLAREILDAAKSLSTVQLDAQVELVVSPAVYGNAPPDNELHAANQAVVEAADEVLEGLVSTLEADVDNLYRIAFRYKQTDEEAAAGIKKAGTP